MTDEYAKIKISDEEKAEARADHFMQYCDGAINYINKFGKSREASLAITNLEQAAMWAVKHFKLTTKEE